MGNQTCMRCGQPCGPGETMCAECRAWFAQQTAGDAGQKNFKKIRMPGRSQSNEGQPAAKPAAPSPVPARKKPAGAGYGGGSDGGARGNASGSAGGGNAGPISGSGNGAGPAGSFGKGTDSAGMPGAGIPGAGANGSGTNSSGTNSAGGGQFCPKCGQKMPAGARFCTNCGNELRRAAQNDKSVKRPENADGSGSVNGLGRAGGSGNTDGPGNVGVSGSADGSGNADGPGNVGVSGSVNGSGSVESAKSAGKSSGAGAKKILIVAAALILVVALVFGVKMILGDKKENKGTQQASSSESSNGNGIGKVVDEETEEERAAREKAEKEQEEKEQREKEEQERLRKEQEEKERAEQEAREKAEREMAIHSYEIVVADCTWEQAYEDCKNRGGYLVRINSAEEYRHIVGMLQNYSKIHFYLGGKRDSGGQEYYWVDNDGAYMEGCLNPGNSWTDEFWFRNEPSFVDTGSGGQGRDIEEAYMNLFCVSGTWYLNDSSGSLAADYPDLLPGKVGYIVEYE